MRRRTRSRVKRKRTYTKRGGTRSAIGKKQRGFVRTSGFYGRFNGNRNSGPGELKFHDVDFDDAAIAADGTIGAAGTVIIIPQGVTESTRVGRKCTIRSILWRYNITLFTQASAGADDIVRVILYLDKQCNGAIATITDLIESDNWKSFNNLANSGRFRVLMDRTHVIAKNSAAGNGTANDAGTCEFSYSFYKKCALPIEYNSTTGALTEIRSNNINVLLFSKSGLCGFISKFRFRFSDN